MQNIDTYLAQSRSALDNLFASLQSYLDKLKSAHVPVFVTSTPIGPGFEAEFEAWTRSNAAHLEHLRTLERAYFAESFSMDALAGAVLQIAEKALECYGQDQKIPQALATVVKPKASKFCGGRDIRSVPLGLVVYAARNQHTHFDDTNLHEPSRTVFELLATNHGYRTDLPFRDPAFDLNNPALISYANNVLALLGWRQFADLEGDIRGAVGI